MSERRKGDGKAFAKPEGSSVGKKQPKHDSGEPVEPPEAVEPQKPARAIARHLQCPLCFTGLGGTGKEKWWARKSPTLVTRAYTCRKCGHNWTALVRDFTEVLAITHQVVKVESQQPTNVKTR